MRLLRDQGHSENPVITRTKRYYLVERDPLRKRIVTPTQYEVLHSRNTLINLTIKKRECVVKCDIHN